ncbi:MAG: hypothetical protein R2856_20280 [Caldilineaceae bacterium]
MTAIAYYYKTYGIMQMLDLADWVLDIRTITAEAFAERLDALWLRREEMQHHLADTLPRIQAQARQAADLIRADFATRSGR